MSTQSRRALFHVGDRVRIDMGRRKYTGTIIEDRGPVGMGGRRIYQVEIPSEPLEPMTVIIPEAELEAVPADLPPPTLDKEKIIKYLVYGGLYAILSSNFRGGRNQPQAWLCLDSLENITHTFVPERGLVGGQIVPVRALRDDRVLASQREAVVTFVESFGLDHAEAERVVTEVGTRR